MINVTTDVGFPVGPAIDLGESGWQLGVIVLAILAFATLVIWLFRARDAGKTTIVVRRAIPRRYAGVARRTPRRRGGLR
jgi:hypothetical protein